jgi:WhiB family redox-sensing transcriptional regulator
MFFSPDGERAGRRARREHAAKQICAHCPVLIECRTHALSAAEPYGIWGGMSESERTRYTRRARLARRQDHHTSSLHDGVRARQMAHAAGTPGTLVQNAY